MRWLLLPAVALALAGCARRPNQHVAYIADGCLIGVGGLGMMTNASGTEYDDPGLGPIEYVYLGMVAAGAVGAGVTYLVNAGSSED